MQSKSGVYKYPVPIGTNRKFSFQLDFDTRFVNTESPSIPLSNQLEQPDYMRNCFLWRLPYLKPGWPEITHPARTRPVRDEISIAT